jgi:hypothetical protein
MALLDCDLTVCHVRNLLTADVATAKTAHARSMTARGQRRRGQQNTEAFHIVLLPEGHFWPAAPDEQFKHHFSIESSIRRAIVFPE